VTEQPRLARGEPTGENPEGGERSAMERNVEPVNGKKSQAVQKRLWKGILCLTGTSNGRPLFFVFDGKLFIWMEDTQAMGL
jgi:hypothetical protein